MHISLKNGYACKEYTLNILGGVDMKIPIKIYIISLISIAFLFSSFATSCKSVKKVNKNGFQASEIKTSTDIPTIEEVVTKLCSNEFGGRRTFSTGNEKAGEYIANIFHKIGLSPLNGNSYFHKYRQEVSYSTEEEAKEASKDKEEPYKIVSNVVGFINGTNSEKAIMISAHYDSLGIKNGNIYRGALDNASGVAALIKLANMLKEASLKNAFETNIIFCAFNGEEQLYAGSSAFVKQLKTMTWYKNMYNIYIDCIGAKNGGKIVFAKDSKYSQKLYDAITLSMNRNNIDFEETKQILGSDNRSFEKAKKPNICISQESLRKWANKPVDNPDVLDYIQIEKIAIALFDFIKSNDETLI